MEAVGDLLSPVSNSTRITQRTRISRETKKAKIFTKRLKLDSKGRILLPSEIRRNFGLDKGSEIDIAFNLEENVIFLEISGNDGQDSVNVSTKACGAFRPGANPGPDPYSTEEGGEGNG
jgi:AbrB family looped-hinge helix DNA binding protein